VGDDRGADDGMELELTAHPAHGDVQVLSDGLERFNRATVGGDGVKTPVAVWMRRGDRVLGGAYGDTHYGWLYLSLLWVDEAFRGRGWGGRLVRHFEAEGAARGCHGAWVDTYEFQAPTFYERLGYREFGRLDEFPPGSARLFFSKPLRPAGEVNLRAAPSLSSKTTTW
jgi:ribosomal protein S18 acetylase RimI-like enzyme